MIVGCCLDFGWIGGVSLDFLQQDFVNVMSELVTVKPCLSHLRVRLGKIRMKFEHLIEILQNNGIEEKDISKALPYQIRSFIREGWTQLDSEVFGTNVLGVPSKKVMIKHHDVAQIRTELEQSQIDEESLSDTIARYSSPQRTKQTPKEKLLNTMNRDNAAYPLPRTDKHWFSKAGKTEFEDVLVRYRVK